MTMIAEGTASFNKSDVGLGGFSPDLAFMSRLMWGKTDVNDGDVIDVVKATRAAISVAEAYNKTHPSDPYIPLMPSIDPVIIQKAIFGAANVPDGSMISPEEYSKMVQPMRDQIIKAQQEITDKLMQKAETTASALMHVIADQQVTYLYKRPYPIQALVPVEANKGKTALWDAIGPFKFGSAAFGVEDPNLVESDITPTNRTDVIKYMYAVGRVTKAAQLAGLAQVPTRDMLAIRIDAAQDAMRALRERAIIGVDRDVSQTANTFKAATALEFKGLYELITTNTTDANYITSNGGTYDQIMKDLDDSYNKMVIDAIQPNLAICDYKTFGIIRRGLMEYFRTDPIKTFVQGISKISLVFPNEDGLPLVPSPFMPMATGSNGAIMMIDSRLWARRVLWLDTYEELAKINTSQKFVISASELLIDKSDVGLNNNPAYSLHGGVFSIPI